MDLRFTQSEQLEKFLADKPAQWSHIIAGRAALRVLPLALCCMPKSHWLKLFRASFISWAAGRFSGNQLGGFASAAAVSAESAIQFIIPNSVKFPASFSGAVSAIALASLSAASADRLAAKNMALSVAISVSAAASVPAPAAATNFALWVAISAEVNGLVARGASGSVPEMTLLPIWSRELPAWIELPWKTVSNSEGASDFVPWINWYRSFIAGDRTNTDYFGADLTLRIAQQADEWWERPVAEVNADIAAWLAERQPQDKGDYINKISELTKQLTQRPAASSFSWADGELKADPPPPVPSDSLAQDFLEEARGKAADLRERLSRTNAAPRVHKSLESLIAVLPAEAADIRPGILRSRARSLHADATAYAGQFQDRELPVDAVAMLLDLSGNLRDLEACFPELQSIEREIVALNLKPTDVAAVQKHLSEINDVVAVSDVVADSAKSVMAVGTETMKAEAPPEIVEVRTAEQALTTRNLANAALQGSLRQILSRLPSTTGRVYDETEKAGLNLVRPMATVGASVLVGSLAGPIAGLAVFALAEYERLPGIINFIKEAAKFVGLDKPEE